MTSEVEISKYGNLLMYKKEYTTAFIEKIIEERKIDGMMIFDDLAPLLNLDFLYECSFLKELVVTMRYDYGFDFLKALPNLIYLSINTYGNRIIDLSCQTQLEKLSITWRTKKIKNLEHCKNLKELSLIEYREADLLPVSALSQLVELTIKTSSIKNLNGIEKLTDLKSILLGNCRALRSINQLLNLSNLQKVQIDTCPNIDDLYLLNHLQTLTDIKVWPKPKE